MTGSSCRIVNPPSRALQDASGGRSDLRGAFAIANEVAGGPSSMMPQDSSNRHLVLRVAIEDRAANGRIGVLRRPAKTPRRPVGRLMLLAAVWLAGHLAVPTLAGLPTTQPEAPDVATAPAKPATSMPARTSAEPAASAGSSGVADDAAGALLRSAEAAIQEAASPLDKSRIAVNTAQQILVEHCAGPLSSWLAGAKPGPELVRRAEAAVNWLDRGAAFLDAGTQRSIGEDVAVGAPGDDDRQGDTVAQDDRSTHDDLGAHGDVAKQDSAGAQDAAAETRWRIEDRIALLRAVAEMFLAIAHDDGSAAAEQRLIDACGDLALYTTDANEALVESLNLWRGAAYRRAGRPERTLQVVRPIIAVPAAKRQGFLARIERCRALNATGNHVAGLALCLRLNARVEAWLSNEGPNAAAQGADTLRFVRIELLRDWAAALRAEGQPDGAASAESQAQKLLADDPFPPPPQRWLQLDATLAGLSPLDAPRAQPTTQPASD